MTHNLVAHWAIVPAIQSQSTWCIHVTYILLGNKWLKSYILSFLSNVCIKKNTLNIMTTIVILFDWHITPEKYICICLYSWENLTQKKNKLADGIFYILVYYNLTEIKKVMINYLIVKQHCFWSLWQYYWYKCSTRWIIYWLIDLWYWSY